jgi:hypothetical protein
MSISIHSTFWRMNAVIRENCQIQGILLLRNPIDAAVLSKAQESIELETFKETSVSKFCHLPLALLNSVNIESH